jgi:hypothetical protein
MPPATANKIKTIAATAIVETPPLRTAVLIVAGATIDALEGDLETKLGLTRSILQHMLRRVGNNRSSGNTRFVSVVLLVPSI